MHIAPNFSVIHEQIKTDDSQRMESTYKMDAPSPNLDSYIIGGVLVVVCILVSSVLIYVVTACISRRQPRVREQTADIPRQRQLTDAELLKDGDGIVRVVVR